MRFLIAIIPLDTYRAKAQNEGGETMPITTDLRRFDATPVDAVAENLTEAEQEEIRTLTADLQGRLSSLATGGNTEAQETCTRMGIPYTPSPT